MKSLAEKFKTSIKNKRNYQIKGRVVKVIGLVIESIGPPAKINEVCKIYIPGKDKPLLAEVVGFKDERVLMMPVGDVSGIEPGCEVVATESPMSIKLSPQLRGRVLNGIGEIIDGGPEIEPSEIRSVHSAAPDPLRRKRITEILPLGITSIDSITTVGKGQRIGIFSGSGVGKSILLGMIARFTAADINVIALTGERGREVRDFIEKDLGEEGLKRSIVIVATSDQPPILRLRAAFVAHTIAEYFRDQGKDVMLMLDSVTRLARAQRQISLSTGEAPALRGFTPSVFAMLPILLERAGTSEKGSVTGLYTILVDSDDMNEPVADNVRAILDGHIVLSRELAHKNHYPAVDILQSISRLMIDIVSEDHLKSAGQLKELVSVYRSSEDLINIGAYSKGSNPKIDRAIEMIDNINNYLRQGISEKREFSQSINTLINMFKK